MIIDMGLRDDAVFYLRGRDGHVWVDNRVTWVRFWWAGVSGDWRKALEGYDDRVKEKLQELTGRRVLR